MRLNYVRPDGTTQRDVLLSAERVSGKPESGLRIEIPPSCAELWSTFLGLAGQRRAGMSTAQPLVWADIEAWCALYQVQLSAWELDTLIDMDAAGRTALAEEQALHVPQPPAKH